MRPVLLTILRVLALSLVLAPTVRPQAGPAVDPAAFTREQVEAALTRALAAHFHVEGELQIELLRPWVAPRRVASAWTINVLEYPPAPVASMLLRCRLLADAVPVADVVLALRASLWTEVWAARQPLTVGATFDPAMLEARRTDVLREHDVLPAAAGDRSYIVTRAVAAGRLLTWRDLARRPLVRKGELVDVVALDGMLLITLKALALENGAPGETVTLRNPESRKNFSAVVVDENRVQVRF